jgi:hypothetical protein
MFEYDLPIRTAVAIVGVARSGGMAERFNAPVLKAK